MKLSSLFLFLFILNGCAGNETLPQQKRADEIRVEKIYPKEQLFKIEDQEKIDEIIAFINSKREGWGVPWFGPPVGKIYIHFYKEKKVNGNFYVGSNFFGRDITNFWSKPASRKEIQKLGELLNIDLLKIIPEAS